MDGNKLKDFQERYNLIFDEQDKLPLKRGEKDYSAIEIRICDMAKKLTKDLVVFKSNIDDPNCSLEIENILSGCRDLMINPYDRTGSRIVID